MIGAQTVICHHQQGKGKGERNGNLSVCMIENRCAPASGHSRFLEYSHQQWIKMIKIKIRVHRHVALNTHLCRLAPSLECWTVETSRDCEKVTYVLAFARAPGRLGFHHILMSHDMYEWTRVVGVL